jgi:predicted nuclease of predicted toxin-antitoxin system
VKFLVDAQLPVRLARFRAGAGHDVVHTSELPEGNRTTDARIAQVADGEGRVVVTKDRDFRDGHLLSGSPRRLLIVATGNITNTVLLSLYERISTRWSVPSARRTSVSWVPRRWSCTRGAD